MSAKSKILEIARSEIGYTSKKNLSDIYKHSEGYGGFYTKYAKELDDLGDFYNTKKNGFDYCAVFYDWLFVSAFGVEAARKVLNRAAYSTSAGVKSAAGRYDACGRLYYSKPEIGDQIFFVTRDGAGKIAVWKHTGIVAGVTDTAITTIEANTTVTISAGVTARGVKQKSYNINSPSIGAFGRPNWALLESDVEDTGEGGDMTVKAQMIKYGDRGDHVKKAQILLTGMGYSIGGVDGICGNGMVSGVKRYQSDHSLEVDGVIGPKTWERLIN